ncbi:diguanylate cyclase, partial [Gemmatimonadota bacterium]
MLPYASGQRRKILIEDQHTRTYTKVLIEVLSHLYEEGDVRTFLGQFLSDTEDLFRAMAVTWWEFEPHENVLLLSAVSDGFEAIDTESSIPAEEGLTGAVLRDGGVQVLEGTAIVGNLPEIITSQQDLETAIVIRVGTGIRPLGILIALFPSPASLAMQQKEIIELVAAALGRALEGNLLREEVEIQFQRLVLLQNFSQLLQSEQPLEIRLKRLVDNLTEAFRAQYGHIIMFEERSGHLQFLAISGLSMAELGDPDIGPGRGIVGKVFESGESKLVPDVTLDPDYIQGFGTVRSELAVPIKAAGEVIGVLNLESDQLDWFSQNDLHLASIVASHTGVALQHALAYESTLTRMRELELLNRVMQLIERIDDFSELLHAIVLEIHTFLQVAVAGIILLEENRVDMRIHATAGGDFETLTTLPLKVGKGITGAAALTGTVQYVPDVTRDDRYIPMDPRIRCELAVPLTDKGSVIGLLNIESEVQDAFSEEDRRVVEIVAAQISQLLSKALLYEEMAKMAVTDGLTGLFNHRHCFIRLEAEFKRAQRYSYPLSLIMMDIDHFKNFNDTYGHLQGDDVLRKIADIITLTMRETDVVARYGGEEFVAILPLCHESTAKEVADRLRQRVEDANLTGGGDTDPITISLGVCTA